MIEIQLALLRVVCLFKGHDFPEWKKVSRTNFLTIALKNMRHCSRCYKSQTKEWTPSQMRRVKTNINKVTHKLMTIEAGVLYGVRFVTTSNVKVKKGKAL